MKCPYCETEVTTKFGHYARHVAQCQERENVPMDESHEDEPPRWRNASPRVAMGGNVVVWRRG